MLHLAVEREAEDVQALVLETGVGLHQGGHGGAAVGAPGGPEIQEDELALEGFQGERRAFQGGHGEGGSRDAHGGLQFGLQPVLGLEGLHGAGEVLLEGFEGGLPVGLGAGVHHLGEVFEEEVPAGGSIGVVGPGLGEVPRGVPAGPAAQGRQEPPVQGPCGGRGGDLLEGHGQLLGGGSLAGQAEVVQPGHQEGLADGRLGFRPQAGGDPGQVLGHVGLEVDGVPAGLDVGGPGLGHGFALGPGLLEDGVGIGRRQGKAENRDGKGAQDHRGSPQPQCRCRFTRSLRESACPKIFSLMLRSSKALRVRIWASMRPAGKTPPSS